MKILNFRLLAILLISFVFIPCCKDDKAKVSPFVGNYVISEAKVAVGFSVPITGLGDIPVSVGTPITAAIQTALLGAVSCSSADKTYVELREDFSLYMSCEGANPLNAGTWTEVSSSELLLNLNSAAVPSAPTGIALTVSDVVKSGGILTGKTTVPIPKEMIAAMMAAINPNLVLDPSAQDIYLVTFTLKFTQK
jgi:hypothetical protein